MLYERRIATKAFSTLEASVGLLACVRPLVADQAGTLTKTLPTVRALKRLFPSVGPLVLY